MCNNVMSAKNKVTAPAKTMYEKNKNKGGNLSSNLFSGLKLNPCSCCGSYGCTLKN